MDINRLKSLSAHERSLVIQSEAAGTEEQTYMKPLTDDELTQFREELAAAAIAKAMLDEELKSIKDEYKAKIEPHASKITESIEILKNRVQKITGKLHKFVDFESKTVYFVNDEGDVINARMMKPEERQYHIQPDVSKTA